MEIEPKEIATGAAESQPARKPGTRLVRMAMGLNAGIAVLLFFALMAMANYLSYRYYARTDWSSRHFYALSDKTLGLLDSLTNEVRVTFVFQLNHEHSANMNHLLKEFEARSPLIRVERVDPDRNLAQAEELARKYSLEDSNVLIVEYDGREKIITADDLMEYDYTPVTYNQKPQAVAFRGEQALSSAIDMVTSGRRPVVSFLQGHGERDPDNFDEVQGYSGIARVMARDNIDVRKLTLGEQASIPADVEVLIVAGPEKSLSGPELNLLKIFLEQKGRVIFLMDPLTSTGLEGPLADWGVRLEKDVVVDGTRTLSGRELFVTEYGAHPVTRALKKITTVFYLPRSVTALDRQSATERTPDQPRVVSLASSSESGWAEHNMDENPMKFDAGIDRPGPVSIAVAVEKGASPGLDVGIPSTRLVVFGDSDFIANGGQVGGNVDFFMSALNWLLDREPLMAIAPKPVEESRLLMDDAQLRWLFYMVVLAVPGIVVVMGALMWLKRRV
ncbi:MAG: GldG family protein [Lentisphaerota bacterium]